ncbi:hypothetical protein HG536_0C05210 [Torulaspora globosa]|uniref:Uncharacterized protein n=1 Tax=Torulaspora globosa TaxID=48254 RepID=A0A7G3ZFR6_9SACH|nr:uncharacterized protein HG536_0C05210 [Torulaspora globosa]QLL32352.1 hypothetical protein HG536_0C05210 [Torulaspora globosa]
MESLSKLGDFCLKALKHTYTLYKRKMLPLDWITLFRTLTICNTILYCLCHWSIDFVESKIEMQQCAEILQHFGEKWGLHQEMRRCVPKHQHHYSRHLSQLRTGPQYGEAQERTIRD